MCDVSCSMVDGGAVCFDTMTRGLQKVRRLSSASSALQPTFQLTTEWLWYWEEDDWKWNQYDSPVSSAQLQDGVPAGGGRVDNWRESPNLP